MQAPPASIHRIVPCWSTMNVVRRSIRHSSSQTP
jgi:hypothetical protein